MASGARVDHRKNNPDDEAYEADLDDTKGVASDGGENPRHGGLSDSGDDSFDVNIQPDVSALRMFRSMSFTPWYALGEFVDNSITSAMKNKDLLVAVNGPDYRVRIQIDFPEGTNDLVIKDNAAGISREEMQRALRMGKAPQDISVGLSRHGVGMKAAAFWWGARLEIKTYPLEEPHGWHTVVDVSEEGEISGEARVTPIPSRGFPGTEVRIANLWQKTPVGRTKGAIRAYLPSIYRAFLGGGTGAVEFACILEYEGVPLRYENPPLLNAPFWPSKEGPAEGAEPGEWRRDFATMLSTGKEVSGWYGILATLSRDKSGFFLHYRGKGIAGVVPVIPTEDGRGGHGAEGAKDAIARASYKPRKIFGPTGMYLDQSFVGEFDVSAFGKTISTDAPLWSPEEEDEFVEALYLNMTSQADRNFIRMAGNYRRKAARETQREIELKNVRERERIESALNDSVEHVEVNELPNTTYDPPAPRDISDPDVEASSTDAQTVTINDRDGHRHVFTIEFINDRSADFIGLFEESGGLAHTVQINRAHPALDDIPEDAKTHLLLQRIAVSLASAEIFVTMRHKDQVRAMMNAHLLMIGSQGLDD